MPTEAADVEAAEVLENRLGKSHAHRFTPVVGLTASRILLCESPITAAVLLHLCLVGGNDATRQRFLLDLALGHLPPSGRLAQHGLKTGDDVLTAAAAAEVIYHRNAKRVEEVNRAIQRFGQLFVIRSINFAGDDPLQGPVEPEGHPEIVEQIEQWVADNDQSLKLVPTVQRKLVDAAIAGQRLFSSRLTDSPRPVIDWRTVTTADPTDTVSEDATTIAACLRDVSKSLSSVEPTPAGRPSSWGHVVRQRLDAPHMRARIDDLRASLDAPGTPLDGADLKLLSELAWHALRVVHPIPASPREVGFSLSLALAEPNDQGGPTRRLPPSWLSAVAHRRAWWADPDHDRSRRLDELVNALAHQQLPVEGEVEGDLEAVPPPPVITWMATRLASTWAARQAPTDGPGVQKKSSPHPVAISTAFDLSLEDALAEIGPYCSLFPVVIRDHEWEKENESKPPVIVWVLAWNERGGSPRRPHFTIAGTDDIAGITTEIVKRHLVGPLVLRLVGCPLIDLSELRARLDGSAAVQHMVAVGEYEALTLAPSLASFEPMSGTTDESLRHERFALGTSAGETTKVAAWRKATENSQIARLPAAVTAILKPPTKDEPKPPTKDEPKPTGDEPKPTGDEPKPTGDDKAPLADDPKKKHSNRSAEEPHKRRDWVFVGQSLSDGSFRSQLYFLPAFTWGALAHTRVASSTPHTATGAYVFDWSVGELEGRFLEKLGVRAYSCDLDELFGQELKK